MSAHDQRDRSESDNPPALPHFAVEAGQAKAAQGSHWPSCVGARRAKYEALALMGGIVGGSLSTRLTGLVIKSVGHVPVFTALGFTHLTAYAIMSTGLRNDEINQERDH